MDPKLEGLIWVSIALGILLSAWYILTMLREAALSEETPLDPDFDLIVDPLVSRDPTHGGGPDEDLVELILQIAADRNYIIETWESLARSQLPDGEPTSVAEAAWFWFEKSKPDCPDKLMVLEGHAIGVRKLLGIMDPYNSHLLIYGMAKYYDGLYLTDEQFLERMQRTFCAATLNKHRCNILAALEFDLLPS